MFYLSSSLQPQAITDKIEGAIKSYGAPLPIISPCLFENKGGGEGHIPRIPYYIYIYTYWCGASIFETKRNVPCSGICACHTGHHQSCMSMDKRLSNVLHNWSKIPFCFCEKASVWRPKTRCWIGDALTQSHSCESCNEQSGSFGAAKITKELYLAQLVCSSSTVGNNDGAKQIFIAIDCMTSISTLEHSVEQMYCD